MHTQQIGRFCHGTALSQQFAGVFDLGGGKDRATAKLHAPPLGGRSAPSCTFDGSVAKIGGSQR